MSSNQQVSISEEISKYPYKGPTGKSGIPGDAELPITEYKRIDCILEYCKDHPVVSCAIVCYKDIYEHVKRHVDANCAEYGIYSGKHIFTFPNNSEIRIFEVSNEKNLREQSHAILAWEFHGVAVINPSHFQYEDLMSIIRRARLGAKKLFVTEEELEVDLNDAYAYERRNEESNMSADKSYEQVDMEQVDEWINKEFTSCSQLSIWQRIKTFFTGCIPFESSLLNAIYSLKIELVEKIAQLKDAEGLYIQRGESVDNLNVKLVEFSSENGRLNQINETNTRDSHLMQNMCDEQSLEIEKLNCVVAEKNNEIKSITNVSCEELATIHSNYTQLNVEQIELLENLDSAKEEKMQAKRRATLAENKYIKLKGVVDTYENNESYELADELHAAKHSNMHLDGENNSLKKKVEELTKERDIALLSSEAAIVDINALGPTGAKGPG